MEATIKVRQTQPTAHELPVVLPRTDGYVSTVECNEIGSVIWLRPVGITQWESFLVVDCASSDPGTHHDGGSSRSWMLRNNILVEVDYQTAERWNTIGRAIDIEMHRSDTQRSYLYN